MQPIDEEGEEINNSDKFIGDQAVSELAQFLTTNTSKRRVDLRGSCIGERGAGALGSMLATNATLTHLSLEWNQVGSIGSNFLSKGLEFNVGLTYLDLRNNSITDDGAIALSHALKTNLHLKCLDLRWNQIDDKGAESFRDSLPERDFVFSLHLSGNRVSQSLLQELNLFFQNNCHVSATPPAVTLPPPPPTVYEPRKDEAHVHKTLLTEIAVLRRQCSDAQDLILDQQRQLDKSAINIVELEQDVERKVFRYNSCLSELQGIQSRIPELVEEQKKLFAQWQVERGEMTLKAQSVAKQKNEQLLACSHQNEALNQQLSKSEVVILSLEEELKLLKESQDDEFQRREEQVHKHRLENGALSNEIRQLKLQIETSNKDLLRQTELSDELKEAHYSEIHDLKEDFRRLEEEGVAKYDKQQNLLEQRIQQIKDLKTDLSECQGNYSAALVDVTQLALEKEQIGEEIGRKVRKEEQDKCAESIHLLHSKLETYLVTKNALEERCNSLSDDIKESNKEKIALMEDTKQALVAKEEELVNLKSSGSQLKELLHETEQHKKRLQIENDGFHKRFDKILSEKDSLNVQVSHAEKENQELQDQIQLLRITLESNTALQVKEIDTIEYTMTRLIQNEFGTLRGNLKIAKNPSK